MAQFCVFCGKEPQGKNAEHVIPQWLMEMTGKKSRPCFLGSMLNGKSIAFTAFKFPACEECNSEFGRMEAAVKPLIVKVLDGQSLTAPEISLLLDWFDKVRVGLWLGELCITKRVDEFSPHMHIGSRVGLKDRMLVIDRAKPDEKRKQCLSFVGPCSESFLYSPSTFQLIINDHTFTSASEYGLVSRRVGFPYQDKMIFMDVEDVRPNTVIKGTNRVLTPVVRDFTPYADQTVIYQPMFKGMNLLAPDLYNTQYVLEHSLDADAGTGGIFYQRGGRPTAYLPADGKLNLSPRVSNRDMLDTATHYYQLQNYILNNTYTTKFATPQVQQERAALQEFLTAKNNRLIDKCRHHKDQALMY